MDFLELQRSIAEVEVNIAPLQHHPFTSCKSELKYFEAAAVGTWTVASATPAFADAIDDGRTGRLARAHEWDDALAEAVDAGPGPCGVRRARGGTAARAHERYAWDTHSASPRRGPGGVLSDEPDEVVCPRPEQTPTAVAAGGRHTRRETSR